ncbi:MAG: GAF and PAS PAC sensor-containing adenylate guanylate cyclase [Trebouxia sp. A1-2]|nr:MAG: GAF and PAS PAC sensor-containing adenylate guanylate cyclase [Trebouxia sp. A1-2]
MFLFRCCVHQTADKKQDDPAEVVEIAATSVSRKMDRPKEGSVTTPGGSRRFGSFAGRFALASSNPTQHREMLDNYDLLSPEQLRAVGVMNQLALELDINSAVDNIRDVVLELLHCERVTLFLVDNQQKELRARVANPEEHWEMIRVPFGVGIAGRVAESGTSMNIPDAYACGLFNPAIDRKTGFRTRNILCCPISDMSGNHVAVIQALNKKHTGVARGTVFSSLDESNLELFGVHLGNMLTKSRFHTAALAEKQRLAKLYEAFRRVNAAASSLEQLVTIILKAVRNLVNSEHNLLLFVDNSRDQLWTKWTLGTVLDNKMGEGLVGQAATQGEGMCCQAVSGKDIMPAFATVLGVQHARSVLIQPIRSAASAQL